MITVPKSFHDDFNFVMDYYGENKEEWKAWARQNLAEAVDKFAEYRKWIDGEKQ